MNSTKTRYVVLRIFYSFRISVSFIFRPTGDFEFSRPLNCNLYDQFREGQSNEVVGRRRVEWWLNVAAADWFRPLSRMYSLVSAPPISPFLFSASCCFWGGDARCACSSPGFLRYFNGGIYAAGPLLPRCAGPCDDMTCIAARCRYSATGNKGGRGYRRIFPEVLGLGGSSCLSILEHAMTMGWWDALLIRRSFLELPVRGWTIEAQRIVTAGGQGPEFPCGTYAHVPHGQCRVANDSLQLNRIRQRHLLCEGIHWKGAIGGDESGERESGELRSGRS